MMWSVNLSDTLLVALFGGSIVAVINQFVDWRVRSNERAKNDRDSVQSYLNHIGRSRSKMRKFGDSISSEELFIVHSSDRISGPGPVVKERMREVLENLEMSTMDCLFGVSNKRIRRKVEELSASMTSTFENQSVDEVSEASGAELNSWVLFLDSKDIRRQEEVLREYLLAGFWGRVLLSVRKQG